MRAKHVILITCAAAAMAGAAFAQQITAPSSPPTGREVNGGAEPGVYTNTTNFDVGRQAGPKAVYAVIAHHLLSGNIQPGSRLLTLADERQPQFVCEVSHRRADIRLACSDGSLAQIRMASGGCGRSTSGEPASLCVGLGANYAARRLTAAPGETLRVEDRRLVLDPAAG